MSEYINMFEGKAIPVDEEGFLLDTSDWSPALASHIANQIEVDMSAAHWEVVQFIRDHFDTTTSVPELRVFLKHLREKYGKDQATRKYVYQLFPYGYGQQACKIAGMRKPRKLMLDV
ncbi:MAG: TusE/DsrC/DsvC family sulfur relay protein [bacterium]